MKKRFPLGFDYKTEIRSIITLLGFAIFMNIILVINIFKHKNYLYYRGRLIPSRFMTDFSELSRGMQFGFILLIIYSVSMIYAHYRYHYKGSKSIYTMKRINDPMELHIRCLIVPLIVIISSILLAGLMIYINYEIYHMLVPKTAINGEQKAKLMEELKTIRYYFSVFEWEWRRTC